MQPQEKHQRFVEEVSVCAEITVDLMALVEVIPFEKIFLGDIEDFKEKKFNTKLRGSWGKF